MDIQGLYAAVAVTDMERSEAFYTVMLGRGPDDRPMDGLIQWRPFDNAGIQLFRDADYAQISDSDGNRLTLAEPPRDMP